MIGKYITQLWPLITTMSYGRCYSCYCSHLALSGNYRGTPNNWWISSCSRLKLPYVQGLPVSHPFYGDSHRCFPRRKIYAIEKLTGAGRTDGCGATSGIWSRKSGFFPGSSMDGSNQVVKFINVFFRFWSPQCAFFTHKNHSGDFDHVWSIFSTSLLGLHMAS